MFEIKKEQKAQESLVDVEAMSTIGERLAGEQIIFVQLIRSRTALRQPQDPNGPQAFVEMKNQLLAGYRPDERVVIDAKFEERMKKAEELKGINFRLIPGVDKPIDQAA